MSNDQQYSLFDFCETMSKMLGLPQPEIDDMSYILHRLSVKMVENFGKPDQIFLSDSTMKAFQDVWGAGVTRKPGQTDDELRKELNKSILEK